MGQPGPAPGHAAEPDCADQAVEVRAPRHDSGGPEERQVAPFAFVQFEFGFPLGPEDGRYLKRSGGEPQQVIVVRTLGARERRRLRGRKPKQVEDAGEAEAVPTSRVTLIGAQPFGSREEAEAWLDGLRGDPEALDAELERAVAELNAALRAHRAAAADPYARDVARSTANVVRVGFGSGDQVAEGRFEAAYAVPDRPGRVKRVAALQPQERLAALLSGSSDLLVAEELVLRARADLAAQRPREAALQARIALEALLAERPQAAERLEEHRAPVADAANTALKGGLSQDQATALEAAVDEMRRALLHATRPDR